MTVVMTLVVGDQADALDSHLLFHLNAGVDVVVVRDEVATGDTREILELYVHGGHVHTMRESASPSSRQEWIRLMESYAATELGADWVIASELGEFWWPRGGGLEELLTEIPRHYDAVQALVRPFLPVDAGEESFAERMVYRLSPQALISDLSSLWRPFRKFARRPVDTGVDGSKVVDGSELRTLRGWYPIEVLSFPVRSPEQLARSDTAWAGEDYASLALDRSELEKGLADGVVQLDTRLRDALRSLQAGADLVFARPTILENAHYAVDVALLGEGEVLKARERMDDLEQRLGAVEANVGVRLERKLRSLIRRGRSLG